MKNQKRKYQKSVIKLGHMSFTWDEENLGYRCKIFEADAIEKFQKFQIEIKWNSMM